MSAPNEKWAEMLFCSHLLRCFGSVPPLLYAPSSRVEHYLGYDATFSGCGVFQEIHLQFKAARANKDGTLAFDLNPQQHKVLRRYPARTAFYVCAAFSTPSATYAAQPPAGAAPADFLAHYVAIDVRDLPEDTTYILFGKDDTPLPKRPRYKRIGDSGKRAEHYLLSSEWCNGKELLCQFCPFLACCATTTPSKKAGWVFATAPNKASWRSPRYLTKFDSERDKELYLQHIWGEERGKLDEFQGSIADLRGSLSQRINADVVLEPLHTLIGEFSMNHIGESGMNQNTSGTRSWGISLRFPLLTEAETTTLFEEFGLLRN
jgi:hypothetical protein